MRKGINKDSDMLKELNELIDNYNYDRNPTVIVGGNFNEIDTPPPRNEGAAFGGGNPHKLYDKIPDLVLQEQSEKIYFDVMRESLRIEKDNGTKERLLNQRKCHHEHL